MTINFGNSDNQAKSICFTVPDTTALFSALKLPNISNISNIKIPKLGVPEFGKLNFGAGKLNVEVPQINIPKLPNSGKLNFGGLENIKNKIDNLKVPITICINVGGDYGFDTVFSQIGDILNSMVPKIPSSEIPPLIQAGSISLIPPMLINPVLPMDLTMEQALSIVKNRCLSSLLDSLRNIDPLERLKKLLEIASDLCSKMLFSQLRDVIEEIQKTQIELLSNALSVITDPLEKLAKLIDMAQDALNSGAYELLEEISKLMGSIKYQSLLEFLDTLDPTLAITALMAEIRNLVNLKNFGPINELLTILQALKAKVQGISNIATTALSLPELSIDQLQNEINRLLETDDILGIQRLLSDFMRFKYATVDELRKLDPNRFLAEMMPLLNSALRNLEFGLFNALTKDLADKLCMTDMNVNNA